MTPKEQEELFQRAYDDWVSSGRSDLSAWNEIWSRVYEACKAIALKICNNCYVPCLEERVMDCTITLVERFERTGNRPRKLSSYCYLPMRGVLYNEKYQKQDRELSYEEYKEYEEITICDEVRGICRKEMMTTRD